MKILCLKILILIVVVFQMPKLNASLIAVMDSGTDMSHRDFSGKAWINKNEKEGKIDNDGDGLPGDVYGYDFTTKNSNPFDNSYVHLLSEDVQKFYEYYAKYELSSITPAEMEWLKNHEEDNDLMRDVDFIGNYIHGTHVAGIAAKDAANVKIMPLKILSTIYDDKGDEDSGSDSTMSDKFPKGSVEQLKRDLIDEATAQVDEMVEMNKVLNFHKVDVVNQSFGVGWEDAKAFISANFEDQLKRNPSKAELEKLMRAYFDELIQTGTKMFKVAPQTLFCIAAGNDGNNNDAHSDYPSNIPAENKIVVAATEGYESLADFSNYGAKNVDVGAPGVAINSTAPNNLYFRLSGTSQATPFVVNTLAQMKDANPVLRAQELKAILLGTVDVKPWLKGKVSTSGIVNRERAVLAAINSKSMAIDLSIEKAKKEIADVPVLKTNRFHFSRLFKLKYHPIRPSLLQIKK